MLEGMLIVGGRGAGGGEIIGCKRRRLEVKRAGQTAVEDVGEQDGQLGQ